MTEHKWFAFYSANADEQHGHTIYARENGEHVKATCASTNEADFDTYAWLDKEKRGVVVRFISAHHLKPIPKLHAGFSDPYEPTYKTIPDNPFLKQ